MTVASTIVPFFGYKYLFSAPEFVRDLILGFVPDEWLHGLDFTGICNLRAVLDRIGAASREQIEAWLDRVLEAPTLEAVFAPLTH